MTNAGLVSVIVTLYNSEKYIGKCLDSLVNQTYENLQIIIVDDASTDGSLIIAHDYAMKDERIIVHQMPCNSGYLEAANYGFIMSEGDFITFLDSDDYCCLTRIEEQINHLMANKLDLVGSGCLIIDEQGEGIIKRIVYPSYKNETSISEIRACGSSVIFHRRVLDGIGYYNPLFSRIGSEDFEWLMRASKSYKFENINKPLYYYRKMEGTITSDIASEYSIKRAISHIIASELVSQMYKSNSKNYWERKEVKLFFNERLSYLLKKESEFPINVTKRNVDSQLFSKKYYLALKEAFLFTLNNKYKWPSYKLFIIVVLKIIFSKFRVLQ